ncbi:acyl-CoA thioesterase II [Halomonas sp. MCCC 1A17488]|uniref:Acyl-CoA thioesterase II n=1 Tax=Billgrantia sulfidoxydans TaxID=2733484 RepID=A0ABX7W1A1_9GAMM|nr:MULTISPECIES: acyl-CoA thioesterase II [Halomonas]MCE8016438.1 acyl-CoA thioesterase II [Halomonas sp. MCCC 1A17488]MCG3239771.1 acyl-CoA thioesterase II [Halomonas sp. MCCC 1A17488]QPP50327.1 acyl-CoA thioesterase II [Halomonas sp. SS10-MC5]QTP53945.1 acyl-CoA thioesterase II [Halomonas sulfidoxydans]
MTDALNALVDLLGLEEIEENLFRGRSQDLGLPQLFGGQVLGQALSAATHTVDASRQAHSLHGYFLRPGDPHRPVVYQVDAVRDGGSFTTRRVTAIQKGRPIFFCSASFHGREESMSHQMAMPSVTLPDVLEEEPHARLERFPGHPIEFLHLGDESEPGQPSRKRLWFRLTGELPDDPALHRYLLAYSSDFNLLTTSLVPHGITFRDPRLQIASLDHALWFHHDVKVNDWLLYDMDSPWAGGARGFARGSIYDRSGRLVASTAQEGLTRLRDAP